MIKAESNFFPVRLSHTEGNVFLKECELTKNSQQFLCSFRIMGEVRFDIQEICLQYAGLCCEKWGEIKQNFVTMSIHTLFLLDDQDEF